MTKIDHANRAETLRKLMFQRYSLAGHNAGNRTWTEVIQLSKGSDEKEPKK